jgi:hypothetical protein
MYVSSMVLKGNAGRPSLGCSEIAVVSKEHQDKEIWDKGTLDSGDVILSRLGVQRLCGTAGMLYCRGQIVNMQAQEI